MNYEPLARKYRPRNFREVVGQDHVVSALSNAISSGRIHHAYLFAGTRGVGKTTMARILAKSLNCLNSPSPTVEICGVCDACRGIASGNFVDVQEIDGASNRGIDEIRNLRENIRYAPVSSRYKIYIIDEAHQITGAAFNALLKTLEEPPKHAVFILATTESSSIPPTIASRCQRYRFKSIPEKEISDTLKKILSDEKIPFEEEALSILARAAQGSLRDAESIAEQAIAFTNRNLTASAVRELLGILPTEMVEMLFDALVSSDTRRLIESANKIMDDGYEPGAIFADMLSVLRATLYLVSGARSPEEGGITDFEKNIAEKYARAFGLDKILRISKLILKARDEMRWTEDVRFLAELYLAKMTQPTLSADEIISAVSDGGESGEKKAPTPVGKIKTADAENPPRLVSSPRCETDAFIEKTVSDADIHKKLLSSIPSGEERLRACLLNVKVKDEGGKVLLMVVPSEFYADNIKRKMATIISCLEKSTGTSYEIKVTVGKTPADAAHPEPSDILDDGSKSCQTNHTSDKVSAAANEKSTSESESDYYEESIFDSPASQRDSDFSDGDIAASSGEDRDGITTLLPDGVKKIKDIFQGKVTKIISSKASPRKTSGEMVAGGTSTSK